MATGQKKPEDAGMVGRLSKRGEEAVARLMDELGSSQRVTDALARATSAKGKVDSGAKRAMGQVGVAAADELKELRKQIEKLEKRLAKLEGESRSSTRKTTAKRAETKKTSSAKKGTAGTAKKTEEPGPAPAPGRSIGGGSGRGSSAG
jgi:polyhydroxyalkanoate synthesis regulator phasin